jgi:hypothetical protein
MKKRMIYFKPRCIIILAVTGIFLSTCNIPNTSKQKHTIESFYRIIITEKFSEIPDSSHLGLIKPYISEHLQKLLIEARNAEDTIAAKETEPVPPAIEGSLFTSLFEGPDSLTSIKADSSAANVFLVELEYKNSTDTAGNKTTFRWSDRVYLIKENGTWVIDDIDLLCNWDFARKARVSDILKWVISIK